MRSITIRELHLQTGRWVRHAATKGAVVITDRGHRVAALLPVDAATVGQPLPDREAKIQRRARIPVDSGGYISEMRDRG
jgi:antitoxin (DNA-binding transcriptional repressor) of toxin-antitoxin stability system